MAAFCLAGVVGVSETATAQSASQQVTSVAVDTAQGITWTSLAPRQKAALMPLQTTWPTLSSVHQRKWIALSQNFANMSVPDKQTLHSRMAEWAALKPIERQQARLNFAETKKTPPAQRAANWEAYQALSTEEKEALAKRATTKPAGAAVAAKAPPPEKLTPVPLTRNSSGSKKDKLATQQPVDPNTLLPLTPPTKVSGSN